MPRQPDFSPDEDAILLATTGLPADETNARLNEAGFPMRKPEAIKYRRYYLRNAEASPEAALTREMGRRRELTREQDRLRKELARVEEQIVESVERIHQLLGEVKSTLA